jgi:predicted GNAT family N-acyltransferase
VNSFHICDHHPTEITGSELVPRTFRFRYEIWSRGAELRADLHSQGLITDEHDLHARHWAVFDGDKLVAAARMCVHDQQNDSPDFVAFSQVQLPIPVATINRLVVHPSARKLGLAYKLDHCRIEAAKKDGAKCVVGTAVQERIAPLQRLGFKLIGSQWVQPYAVSLLFHAMVLNLE